MEKLRIALFMDDFYPSLNGVIEVMDNHAKRLVKKGHDVTVVVPNIDKNYEDNFSYKVIRVPSVKINKIGYDLAVPEVNQFLVNKLKKEQFDIIHIHSPFIMGKFGVKIAKKLNIPVVATMHTQFDRDIFKFTNSKTITKIILKRIMKVYNSCDKCWAVNTDVAKIFKKYGSKKMPGVQLTGSDLYLLSDKEKNQDLINKKFNLKKDDLVFLFVGRLTIVKNILFLLDSLKIMKERKLKFKMLFIGPFEDEDIIKNKVEELKLKDNIIFGGKVTDRLLLSQIFSRSKLFLFPSLYDTNSLVQKEAASQKVPTVFIKGAATACLVTNKKNGFLSSNDPKKYANTIIDILNDEKLYKKVSEGAYSDLFISWDDLIDSLEEDYLKVIKNKR